MSVGITQPPAMLSSTGIDCDLNMGGTAFEVLGRKLAASADVLDSEDGIVHITSGYGAYVEYHTVDIPTDIVAGILRLSVAISPEYSSQTAYIKWMINGIVSPGGEQTYLYVGASTYSTKTEDVYVRPGDHISFYMKCDNNYLYYKEVRVLGAESARSKVGWNLT